MHATGVLPLFRTLRTLSDVAQLLGVSAKQLRYLLRGLSDDERYRAFTVPKRGGGTRTILAPRPEIKYLQRQLAEILKSAFRPASSAHGFINGRSIATNADRHIRNRNVFNLDLKDFFPSIHFGRVQGVISYHLKVQPEVATILAQLCCYKGALPQGAPTSPIVSNMVCRRLDRQLTALAAEFACQYTRYADDITFSKRRETLPAEIGHMSVEKKPTVGNRVKEIVEQNDFVIHPTKVRLSNNTHRQSVTGLVVNNKRNVPRNFIRQIRAMIRAVEVFGFDAANDEHVSKYYRRRGRRSAVPSIENIIQGKLAYVKMVKGVNDPVYRNLQTRFLRISPSYLAIMLKENEKMTRRDFFISHASEDKDSIARPLAEGLIAAGHTVWFDEFEITVGDSLRQKIDDGLARSQFGVVILSPSFFAKHKTWTKRELDGLTAREDVDVKKRILPLWHDITHKEVAAVSPTLAGTLALVTKERTIEQLVKDLAKVLAT